jgi:hypothetical protein
MTTAVAYDATDPGIGPQPANQIVVSGSPQVQYLKIETVANCYPGRLVKRDTDDARIEVCGAGGAALGVLGYEQAPKAYRPATRDTIYLVDAIAPVLSGAGVTVMLYLSADAATIVKGDKLVAAANGCVTKASAAAAATGSTAVTAHTAAPTMVGPIPTEGPIVATAEESATVTDVGGWIMATLER